MNQSASGTGGVSTVSFDVANADALKVFVAIEGQSTSTGSGPLLAY
jgi:hypothetical protein